MTNWNNTANGTGTSSSLTNNFGASATLGANPTTVTWNSPNGTQHANLPTPFNGDNQLMGSFLNTGNGGASTVTISNIPYSSYNVITYVGAEGANGRTADVTTGTGPTYYFQTDNNTGADPYQYIPITNTNNTLFPGGNYTVTTAQTGSSLTVTEANNVGGNQSFSGIMGVEIISTAPGSGALPTTTALSIDTGSALDLNGSTQQVASLSDYTSGSHGTVTNSNTLPGLLMLAPSSGTTTFSGVIQNGTGRVALTLNGAGTQVLAGANTYTRRHHDQQWNAARDGQRR